MGDQIDYWRERREEQKETRRTLLEEADERLSEVRLYASFRGLTVVTPSPAHWQVADERGRKLWNYWPSTKKAQKLPDGRVERGVSLDDLMEKM